MTKNTTDLLKVLIDFIYEDEEEPEHNPLLTDMMMAVDNLKNVCNPVDFQKRMYDTLVAIGDYLVDRCQRERGIIE